MKLLTTAFALYATFCSVAVSVAVPPKGVWKLEIALEKEQYLKHEPMWLDAILTNMSGDTLRTWGLFPPCQGGLNIEMTDSTGKAISYWGPIYELILGAGFVINANESYYDSFDLLRIFGKTGAHRFNSLPTGRYCVKASYGGAISNSICLQIVDASEDQKRTLKSLIGACNFADEQRFGSEKTTVINPIELQPKSPFSEVAAEGNVSATEFIDRFPNSGTTKISLEINAKDLSPAKKKEYLENVMVKYKGTRAAKHAEQLLKLMGK